MIFRFHFRANLIDKALIDSPELKTAIGECKAKISKLMQDKKVLSASLFYAGDMLFLYYEATGELITNKEPYEHCSMAWERPSEFECGEELNTTSVKPMDFMNPISKYLKTWPGQSNDRYFVYMYHIYYHAVPSDVDSWMLNRKPERKRGRIAFLRTDKIFSYVYFHKALVDEGLICGDKYMSIALHENILFSYFEEPRSSVNLSGKSEKSKIIEDYIASGDRDHFIHMQEGNGENFMLLPDLFTM